MTHDVTELPDVIQYLLGNGTLDSVHFPEKPTNQPTFWWRKALREAWNNHAQPAAKAVKLKYMSADQLRLHFGELTADEVRLVRAAMIFAEGRLATADAVRFVDTECPRCSCEFRHIIEPNFSNDPVVPLAILQQVANVLKEAENCKNEPVEVLASQALTALAPFLKGRV